GRTGHGGGRPGVLGPDRVRCGRRSLGSAAATEQLPDLLASSQLFCTVTSTGHLLAATAPRSAACLLPEQSHWNLVDWLLEGCFPGPWFARVKSAFQAQLDPQ